MPYFHDEERWILMMKVLSSLSRSGTSRNVLVSDYNIVKVLWIKPIIFEEKKGYNFKEWQCTSLYLNSDVDKSKLKVELADDRAKRVVILTKNKIPRRWPTCAANLEWKYP